MILTDTINPIETSGLKNEQTFGMQQTRKSFQLLSKLYSDTPLAIVRELGANAKDSHIAAGFPDKPFHIHLPNALEPWLTIEDFGTGISHENVYDIYAVYFCSTKTKNNDAIGCMGLGSKSPFAYTDTFNIESIYDGEHRIYNAYFNEQGLPAISLMGVSPTTESNGVKIQIPVKNEDFLRFSQATQKAFRFFDTKPTITGSSLNWLTEVPTFEGDGWKSYESFNSYECYAVMGGITYPIDINKLDYDHRLFINHTGLVMFFNMGELDFVPSREALDYCDMTVAAINAKIEFIKTNFVERYEQTIQDKPTLLEALRAVNVLNSKFSFLSSNFQKKGLKWNGIDISTPETYVKKLISVPPMVLSRRLYGRSKFKESNVFTLSTKAQWYVDDLKKGTVARVKQYLKNIPNYDEDIVMVFNELAYNDLITAGFDASLFTKTSTLPKMNYNKASGTPRVGFKVYTAGGYYSSWEGNNYDPANPPVYFITRKDNSFNFNLDNAFVRCNEKNHIKQLASFLGIALDEIVMVGVQGAKTLLADGVTPLEDRLATLQIVVDYVALATMNSLSINSYQLDEIVKNESFKSLSATHDFKVYVNKIVQYQKICKKYETYASIVKESPTDSKPDEFNPTDEIVAKLTKDWTSYSWSCKPNLWIMAEIEKREKNLLTSQQNSAIIHP